MGPTAGLDILEGKYLAVTGVRKPNCLAHNLVTVLTTLPRLCSTEGNGRGGGLMVAHTDC